jgi:hypothetical protein
MSANDETQPPYRRELTNTAELADTLPGSDKLAKNMRYPDLFSYSRRIARLIESDGSEELGGLGIALLAGGLGAVLAGQDIESKGVLLSVVVGAVLVLTGILVRRSNTESARSLKRDFNRDLSLVEKGDSTIKLLRAELVKHEEGEIAEERRWLARKVWEARGPH